MAGWKQYTAEIYQTLDVHWSVEGDRRLSISASTPLLWSTKNEGRPPSSFFVGRPVGDGLGWIFVFTIFHHHEKCSIFATKIFQSSPDRNNNKNETEKKVLRYSWLYSW